jgi:hypothetical protein
MKPRDERRKTDDLYGGWMVVKCGAYSEKLKDMKHEGIEEFFLLQLTRSCILVITPFFNFHLVTLLLFC